MDDFDVIADSEGEELEFGLPRARRRDVSSIETAETSFAGAQKRASSIVTATTSFGASLDAAGGARPRPRPIFRNKEKGEGRDALTSLINTATTTTTTSIHYDDDMDFPNILSIADRAKTRQRSAKLPSIPSSGSSTRIPHPFDEEDELYDLNDVTGADEEYAGAASKPKPKPRPRANLDTLLDESDLPGTTDGVRHAPNPFLPPPPLPELRTPELGLPPSPPSPPPAQARPRPRPIKRGQKTNSSPSTTTAANVAAALGEGTADRERQIHQPTSQLSIPIATSPLPPSDPPATSSTFYPFVVNNEHQEIDQDALGLPPIETLPNPGYSPSSLFSDLGEEPEIDAHISTRAGNIRSLADPEVDPLIMGPPSSFFTGPSSPDEQPPPPPQRKKKANSKQPEAGEHVEVIDLCTLPPKSTDIQIIDFKESAKNGRKGKDREKGDGLGAERAKANAKGKRKERDGDEFGWEAEDDDDDEYQEGTKRKKTKLKVKAKVKKSDIGSSKKTRKIVEVVIVNPKPRLQGKDSTTDASDAHHAPEEPRGGWIVGGETLPPSLNVLTGAGKAPRTPHRPVSTGNEPGSPVSSVPDSEGEDMQDLLQVDAYTLATNSGSMANTTAPRISKKRWKGVVYEEDDEDDNAEEIDDQATSPKKKSKTKKGGIQAEKKKTQPRKGGRARGVIISDEEGEHGPEPEPTTTARKSQCKKKPARVLSDTEDEGKDDLIKENVRPHSSGVSSSSSRPKSSSSPKPSSPTTSKSDLQTYKTNANIDSKAIPDTKPVYSSLTSRYTIAPKTKSTPLSELIRRVNSMPLSPFSSSSPIAGKSKDTKSSSTPTPVRTQGTYSPYLKSSRSLLSKIAPLHPNRRTPPPPLPPPPPKKKTKKELEREEKWEEELIDSVGGPAAWSCLPEDERKEMKRVKWAVERGDIED